MHHDAECGARCGGFTVTELLVTTGILAILAGYSIPSFRAVIARNHLSAASDQIRVAVVLARTMAVTLNRRITFCAGSPASGCHGNWTRHEWLVFDDRDSDGIVDAGETTHLVDQARAVDLVALSGNGPFNNRIVFMPIGTGVTASGAFAAGRIRACAEIGSQGEAVDLVLIGSGRLERERRTFDNGCAPL